MTTAEAIKNLNPNLPLHRAHINYIKHIEARGERYSNELNDARGAAWQDAVNGKTEIDQWAEGWVAAWQ